MELQFRDCFGFVDKVFGFAKTHVTDLVSPFRFVFVLFYTKTHGSF